MVLKNILKTKTVSVWGLGYLGYTTMIKLQSSGFNIVVYDTNTSQLKQFMNGKYPDKDQIAIWSKTGYMPKLDFSRITAVGDPKDLFKDSYLHIIAIPRFKRGATSEDIAVSASEIFAKNLKKGAAAPLIVFESAFIPGHIEKYFAGGLKRHGLLCGRDYYLGAMFRTDWSIEAFVNQKYGVPTGGYCENSIKAVEELSDYLGISAVKLGSINEAEIYVNSVNAIQAMVSDFTRQLVLGYPSTDIKRMAKSLFSNMTLDGCALNIGTGGERMTFAIDNLMQGSSSPGNLTLLKEFQDINISSVLSYGEFITRHGYKSVTILGVAYGGNQKDLVLSPSITLADYLVKNSIKVFLNDPLCTEREMYQLVKGSKIAKFPNDVFSSDVLILASDHNEYRHLSQATVDKLTKKTKLIIDNYGIWSHLSFGKGTKYYQVGDGSLNLLK